MSSRQVSQPCAFYRRPSIIPRWTKSAGSVGTAPKTSAMGPAVMKMRYKVLNPAQPRLICLILSRRIFV